MNKFVKTLASSIEIFSEHPKFIIPKLIIAVFYSITLLWTVDLTADAILAPSSEIIVSLLVLLAGTLIVGVLDIIASSMYPFMVEQTKKGKISIKKALDLSLKKSMEIIPSVLVVEFIFLGLAVVLFIPFFFLAYFFGDFFILIFYLIYAVFLFLVVFLFYSIYPVLAFEKNSLIGSLKRTIDLSMNNKRDVTKATGISFVISMLSFAIAFVIEFIPQQEGTIFFWLAFIIVRFLTAYVYSYLYVLNPVFYLEYGKK